MENIDQILEEWKVALDAPIVKTLELSNLTNKSIMDTFINYENKITSSKSESIKVLLIVASIILVALVIFSLLTYFRGAENVTYNLSEMVLGTFLALGGIAVMGRNIIKIKFPDINSKSTLEYLTSLKRNLIFWRTREKPALLAFVTLIPIGIALMLKSVFLVPFYYIFLPLFLLYLISVIFAFRRNNPEFKSILVKIEELLVDLKSS